MHFSTTILVSLLLLKAPGTISAPLPPNMLPPSVLNTIDHTVGEEMVSEVGAALANASEGAFPEHKVENRLVRPEVSISRRDSDDWIEEFFNRVPCVGYHDRKWSWDCNHHNDKRAAPSSERKMAYSHYMNTPWFETDVFNSGQGVVTVSKRGLRDWFRDTMYRLGEWLNKLFGSSSGKWEISRPPVFPGVIDPDHNDVVFGEPAFSPENESESSPTLQKRKDWIPCSGFDKSLFNPKSWDCERDLISILNHEMDGLFGASPRESHETGPVHPDVPISAVQKPDSVARGEVAVSPEEGLENGHMHPGMPVPTRQKRDLPGVFDNAIAKTVHEGYRVHK